MQHHTQTVDSCIYRLAHASICLHKSHYLICSHLQRLAALVYKASSRYFNAAVITIVVTLVGLANIKTGHFNARLHITSC